MGWRGGDVSLLVTVSQVSKFLHCSDRRVRALLAQGRIRGTKVRAGWLIPWPLSVSAGTRGPDLRHYPARLVQKMLEKPGKAVSSFRPGTGMGKGKNVVPGASDVFRGDLAANDEPGRD